MSAESLFDKLPPLAAEAVRAALATPGDAAPVVTRHQYRNLKVTVAPGNSSAQRQQLDAAFAAVMFPSSDAIIPLVATLTPAQRALAEIVAGHVVAIGGFAIPKAAWVRRRWLGLAPAGALERPVLYVHDGEKRRAPLWHALLQLGAVTDDDGAEDRPGARAQLFASLPLGDRLEAYGDIALGAYGLDLDGLTIDLDPLRDEGKAWAPAYADRLLTLFDGDALHLERGEQTGIPDLIKPVVALALVRAGVPLEPRWDGLIPVEDSAITRELLAALPASRRASVVVRALDDMFANQAVRTALGLIGDVSDVALAQAIIDRADDVDGQPKRRILQKLAQLAAAHADIVALVTPALAALPPPLGLRLGALMSPSSAAELTPIHLAQCARGNEMIIGCSDNWVGAEDIAFLQLGEVLDDKGQHAYDFAVFMDEDGVFFRAGTDEPVAVLCQLNLDCPDAALKEALQTILADKPRR
jgi:hypothetical protein